MKKFDLVKVEDQWQLKHKGKVVQDLGSNKDDAKEKLPKAIQQQGGGSVRIRLVNGQIQEERTYPRKNDPRKSKG